MPTPPRRALAGITTLLLTSVLLVLSQAPASAAISTNTTNAGTKLTVTGGNGDELVSFTCDGGNLKVNNKNPSDGPLPCINLQVLEVSMGAGDDTVDARALGSINVPALTSTDIKMGDGKDVVGGSYLEDRIGGGPGNDMILDSGANAVVLANGHLNHDGSDDTISGFEVATIELSAGPSDLSAAAFTGRVLVVGGAGGDTIVTGPGNDVIDGAADQDTIDANGGSDQVVPGPGDDVAAGGPGKDTIIWIGDALLSIGATAATSNVATDSFNGFEQAIYTGSPGPDVVDALGFPGPITFNGNAGGDTFSGSQFDDTINGGPGPDELHGRGGDDAFNGGPDADVCDGGPGKDTFKSC